MEWEKWYLDAVLVPCALLMMFSYHIYLWYKVRTDPFCTIVGTNSRARRSWVAAIMKDNEKKNILAVQTLRNTIMGATLMATTCILLCAGLAAVLSSTYSIKKPLNDAVYGAHGDFTVALKYVTILTIFLFAFFSHSLSIRFINQVNILINSPQEPFSDDFSGIGSFVTPEYVSELLEKAFLLNTVGNRLFYMGLPLMLWIFGPVLVFLSSALIIPVLYNLDFVFLLSNKEKGKVDCNGGCDDDNFSP
ncbi:hypothetical protein CARUB_v10002483mg [Capsella rubella]|uniref:DUF599 domain-containing protein n=1 Tax=Capsella rubella TaxID=81985 RepID=R0HE15_9BRAS|nr:uncharacterized protein LOC17882414 [Capsella rubella]EOA21978.1 hypothetical protein CARUB_v10002483mg [Capsella rubella]